ncbi:MAG: ribosomal RNA small subunit methyltransferase A, partial [Eggerthellaceae bacterium]
KRASAQFGGGSQEGSAPPTKRVPQRSEDCLSDWAVPTLPAGGPTKLVSNLPYAVAATVVLDYFQRFASLESATVMVQKEVADRMAASPGSKNYGAYTVKLRMYAEPAGRFALGPGNFFPPPRVESAVLRLNRRTLRDDVGEPLSPAALEATCLMADAAFASRRKTLSNSCKTYAGRGPQGAAVIARPPQLFERAGIDPRLRGETLDLPESSARLRLPADRLNGSVAEEGSSAEGLPPSSSRPRVATAGCAAKRGFGSEPPAGA